MNFTSSEFQLQTEIANKIKHAIKDSNGLQNLLTFYLNLYSNNSKLFNAISSQIQPLIERKAGQLLEEQEIQLIAQIITHNLDS